MCYQIDLNEIFFNNDDADTGIVTCMCAGPHFFAPDRPNCLFYTDADNCLQTTASSTSKHPTNQPFICGSPL